MLEAALTAVALVVGGIVAGGYTFLTLGLNPVKRGLAPAESVQVHNGLARNIDRFIPQVVIIMVVSAVVLAVRVDAAWIRALFAVGAVAGIVIALVSIRFSRPINRQLPGLVKTPDELNAAFDRWERLQRIRFAASGVAFLAFVVAAVCG
jgi:hypothetical protein